MIFYLQAKTFFHKNKIQPLRVLTGTLWELGPSSPHLLVQARLAQLPHHQTVESHLQDGISFLFWMAQHRLFLNGCALEEIHQSSVIGQICPVSLHPPVFFIYILGYFNESFHRYSNTFSSPLRNRLDKVF